MSTSNSTSPAASGVDAIPAVTFPKTGYVAPFIVSVLSLAGAAVSIVAFAMSKPLQTKLLRPVLYMAICDALWAICGVAFFAPPVFNMTSLNDASPLVCTIFGGVGNFALQATILFFIVITFNMYLAFRGMPGSQRERESFAGIGLESSSWSGRLLCCGCGCFENEQSVDRALLRAVKIEPFLVCAICGVTTVALGVPGYFGVAGGAEQYECWIRGSAPPYTRLTIYLPLVLAMAFATWTLVWVWTVGSRRLSRCHWQQTRRRLVIFVFTFVCVWLPPTITRIWELVVTVQSGGDDTSCVGTLACPPESLLWLHKTLINAAGLANFGVWAGSRPFRSFWARVFPCWCQRRRNKRSRSGRAGAENDNYGSLDRMDDMGGMGGTGGGGGGAAATQQSSSSSSGPPSSDVEGGDYYFADHRHHFSSQQRAHYRDQQQQQQQQSAHDTSSDKDGGGGGEQRLVIDGHHHDVAPLVGSWGGDPSFVPDPEDSHSGTSSASSISATASRPLLEG